jgi:hypothetical protein
MAKYRREKAKSKSNEQLEEQKQHKSMTQPNLLQKQPVISVFCYEQEALLTFN